jgi:hypothetical protein
MGDRGAIELANALLTSSSMKRVKLHQDTHIEERGIQAMVDLAEQNLVLEVFTFSTSLNSPEQMEFQRKFNASMDMNNIRTRGERDRIQESDPKFGMNETKAQK